ncbi:MAG: hypothetical protein ACK4GN_00145 [Runella sp.]
MLKRLNWLGVLAMIVAGVLLVWGLPEWKDVEFGDETTYLGSGLTFSIPFVGGAQWGPLYAAWYGFWHLFVPDRLDLYYFNWALLSILAGVLVFVYLRALGNVFWLSLVISVLFLFSNLNLPLNPKISIAPFCLILGGLIVYQQYTSWLYYQRFLMVALVGVLCAYFRPEFYLSFILAILLAACWLWKERGLILKSKPTFSLVIVLSIIGLQILFDIPLFSSEDRSGIAFIQHFVINYCHWQKIPQPNTIEAQVQLFNQVMGDDVHGFSTALMKQPSLTFKHILTNFINTFKNDAANVKEVFYNTLLIHWQSKWRFLGAFAVFFVLIKSLDYRKVNTIFKFQNHDFKGLLALLVLIFPTLISTFLIYPRTHYLVFHFILILWGISFFVRKITFRPILRFTYTQYAFFWLIIITIFSFISLPSKPRPTPAADNIRFITSLKPQKELYILEREWYRVFLPYQTFWIHVEDYKGNDFGSFVRQNNINFILMTQDMQQYFANDAGFQDFLTKLEAEGFSKQPTNRYGDYLLIKKDVIQ